MGYCATNLEFPVCNHTVGVGSENLGYTRGITETGIPFEAEMVTDEDSLMLVVVMPAIFKKIKVKKRKADILSFTYSVDAWDDSILDIGMVDDGIEEDDDIIHAYVEFLEIEGVVTFSSNVLNGTVFNRVDVLGNDLVKIIITLTENDDTWAYTDLNVKDYDANSNVGKVIAFSSRK